MPAPFNIPGMVYTSSVLSQPPFILILGREKCGKSTLALTLFDYPNKGDQPYVLAFDPTGPDSCSKFGVAVAHTKIKDLPPARFIDKAKMALDNLERAVQQGQRPGSIVLDCFSTMVEKILSEDARFSKNPDPRSNYRVALDFTRDYLNRLIDLGIPLIGLSWLEEGSVEEKEGPNGSKSRRMVLGGASILGKKARALVAGKAQMILILDKVKTGVGSPGADQDGYIRQLHTRTWENIEAGGRYTLPEPSPAHLGWCLNVIMGKIQNPAVQQQA